MVVCIPGTQHLCMCEILYSFLGNPLIIHIYVFVIWGIQFKKLQGL